MSFNSASKPTTRGSVSVFFGPMFSGKSTTLLKKIEKYEKLGKSVLVVNYAHDNRYSQDAMMVTHNRKTHKAIKCFQLSEIEEIYSKYDVIAVDEGQFFHNCAQKCDQYANEGKKVFVAALDATFQRKEFNEVTQLLPIAEKVKKLSATCSGCGSKASFTQRKTCSQQIELIGGEEIYESLCRSCFFERLELHNQILNEEATKQKQVLVKKNSMSSENSDSTDDHEKSETNGSPQKIQQTEATCC